MRRTQTFIALLTVFLALMMASSATAGAAKFHAVSSGVSNSGALVVSFDERGLGNGDISYTLTADATATYACINGGGKHPQAANKETSNGEVTGGGTFASKNGRVSASLAAGPISAGAFACPGGQRLVLAAVSYTNIVLTDTTNGTTAYPADVSRTFFAV
jgi:hypothetical protein